MKIEKIVAREIFDSRGLPTIECELYLENGYYVTSSVPSGKSKSGLEAVELRDKEERMHGYGVLKAIKNIEQIIAPTLKGLSPDVVACDKEMLKLDNTERKEQLGANAILAVSIAVAKAQSAVEGIELFELFAALAEQTTVSLPLPLFNMINGGLHANNRLVAQEILVMPVGVDTLRKAIENGMELYQCLKDYLNRHGYATCVGDEGGFVGPFENEVEAFDVLNTVIQAMGMQDYFVYGLDVAASHFYDEKQQVYTWHNEYYTYEELIAVYKELINAYPIVYLEDGCAQTDHQGWQLLMQEFGNSIQVVGDDLFATHPEYIYEGVLNNMANAAIIKPNQIGTITETIQAMQLCKDYQIDAIVSHRSGDTCETVIADLAVGINARQIKAGGCSRSERLAKYNRLLKIEDQLLQGLLDS